ncbi:MAG: helix-turn-helix transcriptional regulator [Bacteroidales bacterium]|nr:helix-turn-helix transcriptional regulator [Bacteroidales bacterium]
MIKNRKKTAMRQLLDRLGDKWSVLVLEKLENNNTMRFMDLYRNIDHISQKVLSETLHKLEDDQLITRTIYYEVPPRVEYSLTPKGKSLLPHIKNLENWVSQYQNNENQNNNT